MKFYIKNAAGKVVRFGECPEDNFALQAGQGETVHEGEPVLEPLPPLFDTSWAGGRRREYPSIGDQLDALWHSMNNGEIPKAQSFYNAIKAVKDAYPKE